MHYRPVKPSAWLRTHTPRGFTLVEAVIVLFMVGVVATLAGPYFQRFILQQNVRNAAYELMSDLTYARSEAPLR